MTIAMTPTTQAPPLTPTPKTTLTSRETWLLLALSLASIAILLQTLHDSYAGAPLIASLAFSGLAFALTYALIRWLGEVFMKAGLKGRDMSKVRGGEIPETMGAVCAVVYLLVLICFIPFPFYKDIVAATSGGGNKDLVVQASRQHVEMGRFLHRFPHSKLASYLGAILSLQSVVILGIGDDLFDIRWRHKVLVPAFASIPLLIVYFVDFGVTKIVVPIPLRPYLGELFELGWLYYIYMSSISIFCPNSINILAGINGIEVSQSIVIGLLILLNDLIYLLPLSTRPSGPAHPATDSHLFSVYLLLPFLGVSFALLSQNWFPARVFVGDTYCYFAGMVFAVDAILGHFSKTLLLLLIPQIFNFAYSAPQLFGVVPCPRHRLPHFNARTGLLEPSMAEFATSANGVKVVSGAGFDGIEVSEAPAYSRKTKGKPLRPLAQDALKILHKMHLVRVETDPKTGEVLRCSNLTLLNLWLVWFGPLREDRLAMQILGAQGLLGLAGLWVRHRMALWIFSSDNI